MTKVLVVCHGNINRSPLAAAALCQLGGLEVLSAGFVNPGKRASKKMRDAAEQFGLNLQAHRSQLVTSDLLRWADAIVYMDRGNRVRLGVAYRDGGNRVRREAPHPDQWKCLAAYASPPTERVPDPAYMARGSEQFAQTVKMVLGAAGRLHKELRPC